MKNLPLQPSRRRAEALGRLARTTWPVILVVMALTPRPAQAVIVGAGRFDQLISRAPVIVKVRVTNVEDGAVTEWESTESPMAFTYSWRYEDADGGTKVTLRQDVPSISGFFGKLADPIVTRMYARSVRADLENLKEILESRD